MEPKTHRELLALGLLLSSIERVKLAHELLKSVAQGIEEPAPAGEVAETASVYDRIYRSKPHGRLDAASSEGIWESIQAFRAKADLAILDVESVYAEIRDRSPGREVDL